MSGECYSAKNLRTEPITSGEDSKTVDNRNSKSVLTNESETDGHQLSEYETAVSSAENKCNELTGQLEQIKQFYHNQCDSKKTYTQSTNPNVLQQRIGSSVGSIANKNSGLIRQAKKIQQNSNLIATDTSNAPLRAINNILSGITKPINLDDFDQKLSEKSCNIGDVSRANMQTQCDNQLYGVEEVKINTKSNQSIRTKAKTKFTTRKSKSKVSTKTSAINFKKNKKAPLKLLSEKKQNKISDTQIYRQGVPLLNQKSSKKSFSKHRFTMNAQKGIYTSHNKRPNQSSDLVELYHNMAAKECKSSDSDITKKKPVKVIPQVERAETNIDLIPPLTINENETKIQEPRGVVSCIYRNYTLPTISSRMKRVAKYYMNSFNIKSIPFCLSTSTSASHNIGINIQQVMSMVKSKQAITKLSPTLAYNIGLAAGRKDENELPFMVSSATSRTFYSQCPLTKSTLNYQNLQEIAKNIPHEIIEEPEENEEINSPESHSVIITGPSGDVKIKNRKQTIWTAHHDEKKCTCVTPKGISFQQIVNKFNGAGTTSKYKQMGRISSIPPGQFQEQRLERRGAGEQCPKPSTSGTPLQNKEKKLKEVLEKLHDEFAKLTETYDKVAQKTEHDASNPQAMKELEKLDKELSSKEEEIMMVMSLYNEVLALKKQVQTLKERTSKENTSIKNQPKLNGSANVIAAGLLSKLLDRVHHFQTHYKRR